MGFVFLVDCRMCRHSHKLLASTSISSSILLHFAKTVDAGAWIVLCSSSCHWRKPQHVFQPLGQRQLSEWHGHVPIEHHWSFCLWGLLSGVFFFCGCCYDFQGASWMGLHNKLQGVSSMCRHSHKLLASTSISSSILLHFARTVDAGAWIVMCSSSCRWRKPQQHICPRKHCIFLICMQRSVRIQA